MGNACAKSSSSEVESLTDSPYASGADPQASQGYRSRRSSINGDDELSRRSAGAAKYEEETAEDRLLRLKVLNACLSGKVSKVQELIDEHGQRCLDLRSTSFLDDEEVRPLPENLLNYRRSRKGQGLSIHSALPPSQQEVLEKSMGGARSVMMRQQRKQLSSPSCPPPAIALEGYEHPNQPPQSRISPRTPKLSAFSPLRPITTTNSGEMSLAPNDELALAALEAAVDPMPLVETSDAVAVAGEMRATNVQLRDEVAQPKIIGSPLLCACTIGSRELISFLVSREQDVNEVVFGTTPLIVAVRNAHPYELIRFIISRGAKAHVGRSLVEKQALHYAVEVGDPATVRCLLDEKVCVNWLSRDGTTALHYAVKNGFTDVVKLLISKGADPSIRETATGMDCFDIAQVLQFSDIMTLLKQHKRTHPTQFGSASLYKSNNGMINGAVESDLGRSAMAASAIRAQQNREAISITDMDATKCLNPALARSTQNAVPVNKILQNANVELSKPKQTNPNHVSDALEASAQNPRALSDAPKAPGDSDRSAKVLFNNHGWSEKTFHTNMNKKKPPRVVQVPQEQEQGGFGRKRVQPEAPTGEFKFAELLE